MPKGLPILKINKIDIIGNKLIDENCSLFTIHCFLLKSSE